VISNYYGDVPAGGNYHAHMNCIYMNTGCDFILSTQYNHSAASIKIKIKIKQSK
jgi:hypothetical protein